MNIINSLRNGPPNIFRVFWKVKRVLDCRIFKPNLFHSDIVDRKNEYS